MICFRDRTYCSSNTDEHTCGREFTEQDAIDAEKWWGGPDYPVAFGKFCEENTATTPESDDGGALQQQPENVTDGEGGGTATQ